MFAGKIEVSGIFPLVSVELDSFCGRGDLVRIDFPSEPLRDISDVERFAQRIPSNLLPALCGGCGMWLECAYIARSEVEGSVSNKDKLCYSSFRFRILERVAGSHIVRDLNTRLYLSTDIYYVCSGPSRSARQCDALFKIGYDKSFSVRRIRQSTAIRGKRRVWEGIRHLQFHHSIRPLRR
jgi:hypothetical protein